MNNANNPADDRGDDGQAGALVPTGPTTIGRDASGRFAPGQPRRTGRDRP
jgi:hypothetical protein